MDRGSSDAHGAAATVAATGGFVLVTAATIVGLAGTDLVLPAVPSLPSVLGGDTAQAQQVLAAFVLGSAVGLLLFGRLAARFDARDVLAWSLAAYGASSLLALACTSLEALVALRVVQGVAGSAAAVLAPGFLRRLYDGDAAVGALGRLGSIEALVPALAPVLGAWLLARGGWTSSFVVIGVLALLLAGIVAALRARLPVPARADGGGSYAALLRDRTYLRYATSQALVLGGLLVFVLGAPAVMTGHMRGTLDDFIVLQVTCIAVFVVAANLAGRLARRFGTERMIATGTAIAAAGAGAMTIASMLAEPGPRVLAALFAIVGLGLGLRGPPGFHRAIVAARGDDARGAALVIVFVLAVAGGGTLLVAPWIATGPAPLAAATAVATLAALVVLRLLPRLED